MYYLLDTKHKIRQFHVTFHPPKSPVNQLALTHFIHKECSSEWLSNIASSWQGQS